MQRLNPTTQKRTESGQIIIIIAFLMIAMIAMLGLAIDGGSLMFLQRDVQNSLDGAVVAATYAKCAGGTDAQVENAARQAAAKDGYVHGVDGVAVTVDPNYDTDGSIKYIEVRMNVPKESYFIQIVHPDPLHIEGSSVGRCDSGSGGSATFDFANKAIVGMAPASTCSWSVNISGSSLFVNGDVYSNGNAKATGASKHINGYIEYVGTENLSGASMTLNPSSGNPIDTNTELPASAFPPLFDISAYAPGGAKAIAAGSDYHAYSSGKQFKKMTMEGLYYVDGDVQLNQVTTGAKGVTIVATGEIKIANNVSGQQFIPYVDNLTFFSNAVIPGCNARGIHLAGVTNHISGVVYAPYASIKLSGSTLYVCGSLIAQHVDPSGSSNSVIYCDWSPPPPVSLSPPNISIAE